jgi:hypothetical protein
VSGLRLQEGEIRFRTLHSKNLLTFIFSICDTGSPRTQKHLSRVSLIPIHTYQQTLFKLLYIGVFFYFESNHSRFVYITDMKVIIIYTITKFNFRILQILWSRNSSVGIETDYELDSRGSIPGRGKRFFSSPQRPYCPWGPPSLLHNG